MSETLYAGFRASKIGALTATVTDSGGAFSVALEGAYCHVDTGGFADLSKFADALETELNAESGVGGYSVSYSLLLGYFVSGPSHSWASISAPLQSVMGLSGATLSSAVTQASAVRPHYVIGTASGCKSNDSDEYEPGRVVSGGHTLGGRHFGVAAQDPIRFRDFEYMFEAKEAVFAADAESAVPWTYEHLVLHCRSDEPIYIVGEASAPETGHYLRPEGAQFDQQFRRREKPDWDGAWHIRFRTYAKWSA